MAEEVIAVIAVGSNIEPERNLPRGIWHLEALGDLEAASTSHRTTSVGPDGRPDGNPDFLNAAVRLRTRQTQEALQASLREIEAACGRRRRADRYAPRTLDLDLIAFDDELVDPEALQHDHVRLPVAEVAPEWLKTGAKTL